MAEERNAAADRCPTVVGVRRVQVPARGDRGSQFHSRAFVARLRHHNMIGSMGRVGACGDNAMMKSFFSLLQKNVLDRQRWRTRAELTSRIVNWVEWTYIRRG